MAAATTYTGPVGAARRWAREVLPQGGLLAQESWERRHRAIVVLLSLHAIVIAAAVAWRDFSLPHAIFEGSIVGIAAVVASFPQLGRTWRAVAASAGLLTASAILVHLSGGYIEMHFHFFVMIIVIALYQDWAPFLVAIGYVVLHHGIVGTIDPSSVYNHPGAIAQPWAWAAVHGAFIVGASAAAIVAWRLNEELVRRQIEIEQSARRAAEAGVRVREEFLSIATHELRTPVTSVKGYAQLALRAIEAADVARARQTLRTLDEQTDRLSRLITQLLDVSRIEAGRLELEPDRADLGLLVLRLVDAARQRSAMHSWDVDVPTEIYATIDSARIEQVISNLLDNAIRYSPDGGTITVRLRREQGDIQIEVLDQGLGIPPERLPHVFERFYQAHSDRNYGGMGLGLYISREIVQRHGGNINVDSREGRGTSFTVVLPIAAVRTSAVDDAPRGRQPVQQRPLKRTGGGGGRIWVIEDDDDIRALVSSVLRDAGYEVAAFRSGVPALEMLDRESPAVILLDKLMPEMTGTEFAAALDARRGQRPRLIAMCAARDAAEWAASIGAVGYVPKPFDIDDLLHALAQHITASPAPVN